MIRRPPRTALYPYATLSLTRLLHDDAHPAARRPPLRAARRQHRRARDGGEPVARRARLAGAVGARQALPPARHGRAQAAVARSEEHTSELQSRQYLVCRLLL